MSYVIAIGELKIYEKDGQYSLGVEKREIPGFGSENILSPATGDFLNFCIATGLKKLFLDKDNGLMRGKGGVSVLKREHVKEICRIRKEWESTCPIKGSRSLNKTKRPVLARLLWFERWMKWAVKNCVNPAIWYNC